MRFMGTSLSKLVENLTEGIHEIKCKYCVWWPITANQNNNNNNKNNKNRKKKKSKMKIKKMKN